MTNTEQKHKPDQAKLDQWTEKYGKGPKIGKITDIKNLPIIEKARGQSKALNEILNDPDFKRVVEGEEFKKLMSKTSPKLLIIQNMYEGPNADKVVINMLRAQYKTKDLHRIDNAQNKARAEHIGDAAAVMSAEIINVLSSLAGKGVPFKRLDPSYLRDHKNDSAGALEYFYKHNPIAKELNLHHVRGTCRGQVVQELDVLIRILKKIRQAPPPPTTTTFTFTQLDEVKDVPHSKSPTIVTREQPTSHSEGGPSISSSARQGPDALGVKRKPGHSSIQAIIAPDWMARCIEQACIPPTHF